MYSPTLEYYRQSQFYKEIQNLYLLGLTGISLYPYPTTTQKIRNWSKTAKLNLYNLIY